MDVVWSHLGRHQCIAFTWRFWQSFFQVKRPPNSFSSQQVCFRRMSRDECVELIACTGITKGKNAANYIFWLHGLKPTIHETPENKDKGPESRGPIAVDSVHFSYPLRPEAPVLRGINLEVCIRISELIIAIFSYHCRFRKASSLLWSERLAAANPL